MLGSTAELTPQPPGPGFSRENEDKRLLTSFSQVHPRTTQDKTRPGISQWPPLYGPELGNKVSVHTVVAGPSFLPLGLVAKSPEGKMEVLALSGAMELAIDCPRAKCQHLYSDSN